ncbi:Receptor expression-enhancing protein 2 [Escovopsis weberi]|uniref:Protein YOP1 n=1 Tax=Escovopsis weberi TaxID=150374 RepID=A0A0M9VUK2_ESCWE|nr:Receptor expression-enhancing protein 2 [Escovopsis weberi]
MFDLLAMLLSSVASFLFPIFASYKALQTSDPAQLTPWLMYWVVFSCALLAESWVYFILAWVPFYGYIRLAFFLYLMLPQTQGARVLYEQYVRPFLHENEGQIDDFIASAHDRLRAAGLVYIRRLIDYLRTQVLGLPPVEREPAPPSPPPPKGYTQALLARFSIPSAAAAGSGASSVGSEFYNLLAKAVTSATAASSSSSPSSSPSRDGHDHGHSVVPSHLQDSKERMSFIAAQRDRLNIILSALDREAAQLQGSEEDEPAPRPPSGLSTWSGISKSRSETDFEKIDVDSGAEDDAAVRRRHANNAAAAAAAADDSGAWIPWNRHPDAKTTGRED